MPPSGTDTSISQSTQTFLQAQTRLLSAPLQLSSTYRSNLYLTSNPLSDKQIADVTHKVNEKIKQHNRQVFSAQSIRHVAEQVETLIWRDVKEEIREGGGGDVGGESGEYVMVERDVELSEDGWRGLPEELEDVMMMAEEGGVDVDVAERYAQLRQQVIALAKKRDEARERLQRYEKLKALLKPYENPHEKIQPNLVTKDGEMGKNLDRMRVLMARVGARIGEYEPHEGANQAGKQGMGFDERLAEVMDLG